jgi:hypothetical protein
MKITKYQFLYGTYGHRKGEDNEQCSMFGKHRPLDTPEASKGVQEELSSPAGHHLYVVKM